MSRDIGLVIVLCLQSALSAGASSSALAEVFPPKIVAAASLLNAMASAATAAYVAATRRHDPVEKPVTPRTGAGGH